MALMTQTDIRVSDDSETVVIQIGSDILRMHYEDALKISQMIRVHAKRAKNSAGDMSRHWSIIADLQGVEG